MEANLLRTGSVPVRHPILSRSTKTSLSRHNSITGSFPVDHRNAFSSRRINLHCLKTDHSQSQANGIRRSLSENDVMESAKDVPRVLGGVGSRSFPEIIQEEENVDDSGSLSLKNEGVDDDLSFSRSRISVEELGFSSGGYGNGYGGNSNYNRNLGGNYNEKRKIGDYYREMLKSNSDNPLLLRNYGSYLYEVEKETEKAEEYYGRAILASPGDGELLCLYGKFIWETQRDRNRAKAYFDIAVHASPNDSMVLGSYAKFMWEADEEEDDECLKEL